MTRLAIVLTLVICALHASPASALVRTVPGDYPTINAAVAAAAPGDMIVVSPGIYDEWIWVDFGPIPSIVSTDPDDPAIVASTVILGGIRIFSFDGEAAGTGAQISGFTMRGSGIVCEAATEASPPLIISNNVFDNCDWGVDIWPEFGLATWIVNNTISGCLTGIQSQLPPEEPHPWELDLFKAHYPFVIGNTISDCFVGMEGRFADVIGNTIKDNLDGAAERMVFDEFAYNDVTGNYGIGLSLSEAVWEWGVVDDIPDLHFTWDSPKPIHNNTFAGNDVGMILAPMSVTDSNTIVANDQAGVVVFGDLPPEEPHDQILRNSIIFANGIAVEDPAGYGIISYCCSNESLPGDGNMVCDPRFVNPAAGDYHLSEASPCINRGTPDYDWQISTTDRDDDLRVVGGRIDIGSDETPYTPPPLAGDMNGDGTLDGLDVQLFVEAMVNQ